MPVTLLLHIAGVHKELMETSVCDNGPERRRLASPQAARCPALALHTPAESVSARKGTCMLDEHERRCPACGHPLVTRYNVGSGPNDAVTLPCEWCEDERAKEQVKILVALQKDQARHRTDASQSWTTPLPVPADLKDVTAFRLDRATVSIGKWERLLPAVAFVLIRWHPWAIYRCCYLLSRSWNPLRTPGLLAWHGKVTYNVTYGSHEPPY